MAGKKGKNTIEKAKDTTGPIINHCHDSMMVVDKTIDCLIDYGFKAIKEKMMEKLLIP